MSGFGYGGGNASSSAEKSQLMDQVKGQIALANAQELVQRMTDKCFKKCVVYPSTGGLDTRQQNCISNCVERFMESWNIVSKSYNDRMQRDRVGMQ